jgi:hypothetical protein
MKYIIFILLFTVGFAVHFIRKREAGRIIWFALFPLFFLLLFFGYLFMAYGNLSPMSIYTGVMTEEQARDYYENVHRIPLKNRIETLLDYFFDQRDGLLLYNPFYFFFFPGVILAFKKIKKYGNHLLVSAAGFVYLLYHGYSTVRPGVCPQARYLVPIGWVLLLFAVIYYLETRNNFMKKMFWLVPFYSFFVVLFQVLNPYTLYQTTTHDFLYRPGLMFQKWSNIYVNLSGLLPSFIKSVPSLQSPFYRPSSNHDYLPNIIGLLLFTVLVLFALIRWKRGSVRWLAPAAFLGLFLIFVLFPRVPLYNPVLVNPDGSIPHLVHGAAFHPGKAAHKRLTIRRNGIHRWLISTRRKAGYIRLALDNRGKDDLKVEMFNFDSPVSGAERLSPEIRELVLDNPRYRLHRGRYYYQFNIMVKGGDRGRIRLIAECLPYRR